ncbi:MAG: uroporphyrinogen III methylase [Gammaproteobacteria bacterium]|nr:uroporphyrinogen III methylase [Gammaproteobacteria bacterium]
MAIDPTQASLVIVGSGIKFLSHLTTEARAYIEQSQKVLYLINEPAMQAWIQKQNPNHESLDPIYSRYKLRLHCYEAITDHILATLRQNIHVCVVYYGHPTVFAQSALNAVLKAREEGYAAKALPGISAEDCLFADLLIDPGILGCQSFETTDFLVHHRRFDPTSNLILWQVGIIGVLEHAITLDNRHGATLLQQRLLTEYPADHKVILYEAAQYSLFEHKAIEVPLADLPDAPFSRITTLYVPPARYAKYDPEMIRALNMNFEDLVGRSEKTLREKEA